MTRILALDPSGTSITGCFYFENWSKYQIFSIESKNWLEQGKKIENELKNKQVNILACEVSNLWQKERFTYHYANLIKLVGHVEYLANELGIKYVPVSNIYRTKWEKQAKEGKIPSLVCQAEKGLKGRAKKVWYFKDKQLNEHEKDAVLIFYTYWVKFSKKEWPWV